MKQIKDITDWKECINQVICGDSLELMRLIPDKSIDLCLCDPPYGIGRNKTIKTKTGINKFGKIKTNAIYHEGDWDNFIPSKDFFKEIIRISKNQIIWGGNYFVEHLTNSPCWIVWHKKVNDKSNNADCELAWTSFKTAVRYYQFGWVGLDGVNSGEKRQHPTQKPLELMRWCLENYAKEGDLIFDGFAGSFTTARACKDMGFDWIAIDKEEKYCQIGEKRLDQEILNI